MTIPKCWLKNTCDINHITLSSVGRVVDSTDTDVACRKQSIKRLVRTETGDHIIYKTKLYFHPDTTIDPTCEIVIDSKIRKIEEFLESVNGVGNLHHYEIILT